MGLFRKKIKRNVANIKTQKPKLKMHILFTPKAYSKMLHLVSKIGTECAWHGLVDRKSDTEFVVYDIIVFPQIVTGATVDTDDLAYSTFIGDLKEDVFKNLKMQGHSHVNMGAYASGTDTKHQESIKKQLIRPDDYYIFIIMNKKLDYYVRVIDNKTDAEYSIDDVEINTVFDINKFSNDALEMMCPPKPKDDKKKETKELTNFFVDSEPENTDIYEYISDGHWGLFEDLYPRESGIMASSDIDNNENSNVEDCDEIESYEEDDLQQTIGEYIDEIKDKISYDLRDEINKAVDNAIEVFTEKIYEEISREFEERVDDILFPKEEV